jgi:hypothetical protein
VEGGIREEEQIRMRENRRKENKSKKNGRKNKKIAKSILDI